MVNLEVKEPIRAQSFARTKTKFLRLKKMTSDLRPLWKEFIPFYQDVIIKGAFDTRGRVMNGQRWKPYSPKYLARRKKMGFGAGQMLVLTGEMKDAARGGSGWYQDLKKKELTIGIKRRKWWEYHQFGAGKIPQRPYFMTKDDDLPARAWTWLLDKAQEMFEDAIK